MDNSDTTKSEQVDIFNWANLTDGLKDNLDIDLYLFTKGYTVYSTQYDDSLKQQLKILFLYDMISGVQTGAASGLVVRDLDQLDREDNVVMRTKLEKVEHAQEVIEQIAYGEEALEVFNENDHEFKKIKGMIARFRVQDKKNKTSEPFYVVKLLSGSQVMLGTTAWAFKGSSFGAFEAEAGLRVTPDNQVLIVNDDIFVFSESKFERLFGYSAKKFAVAEAKVQEILDNFKLSLPDGLTFSELVKDNKTLVNKLQKIDPTSVTQDQVVDQADSMELDLMTDDSAQSIILVDARDATKFVNLLSDDYMASDMTGIKYLVKSKKPLEKKNEDPLISLANRDE
jgi:hypothetical protein